MFVSLWAAVLAKVHYGARIRKLAAETQQNRLDSWKKGTVTIKILEIRICAKIGLRMVVVLNQVGELSNKYSTIGTTGTTVAMIMTMMTDMVGLTQYLKREKLVRQ